MNRLKPCPFCGSTNLKSRGDDKHVGYWCSECGAAGPNHYDSRFDWNTRAALSAPKAEAVSWDGMQTAPKDGTIVRLLVVPDPEAWTPFDDSHNPYETIGFNNLTDTQEDRWEFVGWDWNHDCFVSGLGEVIGWLPFHASPVPAITDEAVYRAVRAHDREEASHRGEPDPWEAGYPEDEMADRMFAMRLALLAAFHSNGAAQ